MLEIRTCNALVHIGNPELETIYIIFLKYNTLKQQQIYN